MSGLAKTFHTPRSVNVVPAEGMDRNRSLALGCCSDAGKSFAVLFPSVGIASPVNAPGAWPPPIAGSSNSRWVTPVLCNLKSVKLGCDMTGETVSDFACGYSAGEAVVAAG